MFKSLNVKKFKKQTKIKKHFRIDDYLTPLELVFLSFKREHLLNLPFKIL